MNNLVMSSTRALLIVIILYMLTWVLITRPHYSSREKISPFECGFDPNHIARIPFSIRFFLLAIIFIVFDIEIVLLIPLPIIIISSNISIIIAGGAIFLVILLVGLFHEWNQGSLEWSR